MFAKQFITKEKSKIAIICLLIMLIVTLFGCKVLSNNSSYSLVSLSLSEKQNKEFIYLSDLDYLTTSGMSQNGWSGHNIQKDKNQEGGILSLIINGEKRPYAKGLSIHANGWATYNIEELSNEYTRFTAKLGVDASRNTNGSLFYRIYASQDATSWDTLLQTPILTGISEAINVDLNVTGYKYLRIYVDANGDNSSDHGTIASAKLVKADYVEQDLFYNKINKVEYYDNILKSQSPEDNYNNNHKTFLVRELVNKLGYWNIQNAVEVNTAVAETLDWILENNTVLEETIEVGEIYNGTLFLQVLSDLYHNYKNELKTTNGYVYEKMMIALAAAYSTDRIISPLSFGFPVASYDYVERFKIMKDYFDNNEFRKFSTNILQGGAFEPHDWFKDYHVELMRMVMQDGTSNIDLKWLNGFTNEKQSISFYMIDYVSPTYTLDKYYAEENKEQYDKQFYLSKYGVPYGLVNGTKISRYWMIFANGGICWNASRAGQSMYRVNGIPATGAYQVGHELYLQYYKSSDGSGYWSTRYGNWSGAGSTWGGSNPYRYMFNWNNKYFADRHISGSKVATSTGYLYLAQDNLNHYDAYKESAYYNLIANSYDNNAQKLAAYDKALKINPINLDSYDGIINVYKVMSANGEISVEEWYELALKIIEAYEFHPVAMFDLLKVIRPYLEGSQKLHVDRLEKETLTRATKTTTAFQAEAVRIHASNLLNKAQPDPMTFSFDGDKGGIIVKNPIYQLAWGYSLDGGKTWAKFDNDGTETEFSNADEIALTKEEIASITSEQDIQFKFMGLSDFKFTIDITEGSLSNLLYANDLENRVVGVDLTYEWRNSESDEWTSYKKASPDNTGNKTLYVRRGNTGTQLASNSATYIFTADNQPNTRKYIPVSHLSIADVSTEATNNAGAAIYAIDGNYNTRWHSAWNGSDTERFITIKLDKPRYISAVEFVPAGGGNGKIYDGTIYGCNKKNINECNEENGWEILARRTNITYSNAANDIDQAKENTKSFDIDAPKEVQYIKIVADRTNGNWFTARAFNLFQDITNKKRPTAGVGYSTTNPTTGNVIARLVNVSAEHYEILSPGGDTHEFTDNGEFVFEFKDLDTNLQGTATAKVDWIDRIVPTAEIEFSTTNPINSSVFATLKPSEDIKVTNNGYYSINDEGEVFDKDGHIIPDYIVDENGVVKDSTGKIINPLSYEFLDNGEFTFEFIDRAGNKGSATAKVDWIDFEKPEATLSYNHTTLTNEDVIVTINFNEEAKVLNNDTNTSYTFTNNGEFTFEFSDLAGNKNTITAKVDWMDKIPPTAELKYERTKDKVIVTVINPSEEITFKEGIGIYEFTKNGNYEIIFYDKAGNVTKLIANITGLKDESSGNNKPDKPNPPVEPDNPTNPNNPDDNKPSEPNEDTGNNGNNRPNTNPGNNPSENNNSNSGMENNKPVEPINKEYQQFSTANVSVQIPTKELNGEATLKSVPFAPPSSLLNTFGEMSEYYDIYLDNGLKRIDFTSESPIKISIKRNKNKRFIGVYEITEDNYIKLIEYEQNGDNIEIVTNKLGKYAISYKELQLPDSTIVIPSIVKDKEKSTNIILIFTCIIALGTAIYIFYNKKDSLK